ncbi:MAG TPA: TauD/TfdA family dioxygenase [Acidimicrobiales bacterium]|nr:TauD/TfdA family dioxygenase [Acidimicrobiales bacterium]
MRIQPLTGVLGAEITDVDLARELTKTAIDDVVGALTAALDEHLVVVIRDQDLSPQEQTALTHMFGPPCETPFVSTMRDAPEVIRVVKEADEVHAFNFGGAWHSDFSFLERPPSYTLLHAIDVPAYGGDTVWTSNIAALDRLGPHLRAPIDKPDGKGVHTAKDAYSPKMQTLHDGLKSMDIRTTEDANEARTHPIITTHPGNRHQVLFFNFAYCRDLADVEVEPERVPAFLLSLHRHTTDHAFTVRHRWRNGDLAIWDNRATQHFALNDYGGFRRELHRTTVQGGVPAR